jgi:hypothetical protein
MISTNIDGSSGGTNQLFDLLALVSNPDAYKAKLDQLQKTIDENKKFIALVGPASDVLALRDVLAANTSESKAALADAKVKAAEIKDSAESQAKDVVQKAHEVANQLIADANAAKESSIAEALETTNALKAAKTVQIAADKLKVSGESKLIELNTAIKEVSQAQIEVDALKASIIAAHQAFIAGL